MISDNTWYGHSFILALYCGLLEPKPIFGSVIHGWWSDLPPLGHRRISSAPLLVWSTRHAEQARGHGVPNVVAMGAPFAYLVKMLMREGEPSAGSGTICFPYHSADYIRVERAHDEFIHEVERSCPGPYTVSIFYQDLDDRSLVAAYRRAGWRVVSFGNRGDPLFLFRLYAELVSHSHAVGDALGSALWYAGLLGRSIRVLGPLPRAVTDRGEVDETHDLARRWPAVHSAGLAGTEARSLAGIELGWDLVLAPDELAELLGWGRSWRGPAARVIRRLVDLRYGKAIRYE